MSLKGVVKQKKKELEKIIRKVPKDYRWSYRMTCRSCLTQGIEDNEASHKRYLSATPIDQKEICKIAYNIGISFGPREKQYAKEQLIDEWLTKKIKDYMEKSTKKKFLGLF